MGLTVRADLDISSSPIHESHDHFQGQPFHFDHCGGAGELGGSQGSNQGGNQASNLLQQLSGLLQQLQGTLQQLQGGGQGGQCGSQGSSGGGGPLGQLQNAINQLGQLTQGGSQGGQLGGVLQQINQLVQQLTGQGNPSQCGQGGQGGQGGYQPASFGGSSPSCGPTSCGGSNNQGSLSIGPNNTVDTGRYSINVSNATGGQLTVTDKSNGKTFTVWGDPHGTTPNGGSYDFQQNPVMYHLPDGTSIEVDPTKNSGVNYINSVEIRKGGAGVEFNGVNSGNITESAISGAPSNSNQPMIGINVDNNDNQTIQGGPAINGSMGDIDQYAQQQPNGWGSHGGWGSQGGLGSQGAGHQMVHEGRELEQYGHKLQSEGKFREGARLIQEGRQLEHQGHSLQRLGGSQFGGGQYGSGAQGGSQGSPSQGSQLMSQVENLLGEISGVTQQIGQLGLQSFLGGGLLSFL
jgi:hypothetical protein